jgi:hypothetical protein
MFWISIERNTGTSRVLKRWLSSMQSISESYLVRSKPVVQRNIFPEQWKCWISSSTTASMNNLRYRIKVIFFCFGHDIYFACLGLALAFCEDVQEHLHQSQSRCWIRTRVGSTVVRKLQHLQPVEVGPQSRISIHIS